MAKLGETNKESNNKFIMAVVKLPKGPQIRPNVAIKPVSAETFEIDEFKDIKIETFKNKTMKNNTTDIIIFL